MSLDYVKFSNGFEKFMPKEYRDMVEHGPFGKKVSVSQMGSFKEVLEEHPMCAGCAMTLFIRLAMIAFPNPEDTITVGTAGCGRLAISQAAIPFVYGNYGDQNGVASGLSRGLRLRFGDKPKDVVVMAGDGGTADIGFQQVLHSWFRKERFTTIMLDNEVYGTLDSEHTVGNVLAGRLAGDIPTVVGRSEGAGDYRGTGAAPGNGQKVGAGRIGSS